ncbi:MAG: histone [Chlamydiales bacterium]|nr:histone [Chlamydiia bacterium]MCP5504921.1 histone [Chlamydiales bacterium]
MTLSNTIKNMEAMLMDLAMDLRKASEKGNKAASQRVRTGTIKFAKLAKQYRKESIAADKKGGKKRKAKKTTRKKKATKKKATRKKAPARKKKAVRRQKRR